MGGGWDLDKYKFIHIIEKTWQMRPGMDWYVFAEADTYVFWDALSHFLRERAMPKDFLYVGSVAFISSFPFAHGGSGYVISGPLLEKIATIPDVTAKYDLRAMTECCGDLIVSLAADEAGAKVKQAHPMFNGEKPSTLPYGPGHWCEPIFTMHHMNPEEVSSVWQYEQTRTKTVSNTRRHPIKLALLTLLEGLHSNQGHVSHLLCTTPHLSQRRLGQHGPRPMLHRT